MEEYTQPLIQQIQALSPNAQQLILSRIARIFPEIIQKEIKSVVKIDQDTNSNTAQQNDTEIDVPVAEVTALTLKSDVDELYRHSKPTQIFGEFINHNLQRKASEKANSKKVDKQLDAWKKQQKEVEQKKLRDLKEER